LLLTIVGYVAATASFISHKQLSLFDAARQRPILVDIAIRRDKEAQALLGMDKMPVVIINHGNTVRYTEYSFIANLFAAKGYIAVSIQHDLDTDAPLMTKVGELYVGRKPVYDRGAANIDFVLQRLRTMRLGGDYEHLTLFGHSNGGDISMYYAKLHPEMIKAIVTLDNLRVPLQGAFKIFSVRSKDPNFVADPGVIPSDEVCKHSGIVIVHTNYRHTDMSDRGPDGVKANIENALSKFIDQNSDLAPVDTDKIYLPAS
jgi:hypothetical protein